VKVFLRVVSFLRQYLGYTVANLIFNILSAFFSLFSVVMVIPLPQLLFGQIPEITIKPELTFNATSFLDWIKFLLSQEKNSNGVLSALIWVCFTVVVIIFLKNFFRYLALRALAPIRNGVLRDLRNQLYDKIVSLSLPYYSRIKKGDLISRVTNDVKAVEMGIISMLEVSVREPINILLSIIWMMMISTKLTLFVLLMLVITGAIIGKIGKSLKRHSYDTQSSIGQMIAVIEESISGLKIIQAFNAQNFRKQKFEDINSTVYHQANRINLQYELSSPLTEFLSICVFSTVLWFGGNMVLSNALDAATFIGFIAMFSLLIQPAKSFANAFYNVRIGLAAADRVFEVIDTPQDIQDDINATPIHSFKTSLRFENVNFSYAESERNILHNVNFELKKGKMLAIVGASGSGKTTLMDLLLRFYNPLSGNIYIDNQNVSAITIESTRQLLALVSQEPVLFNDSVYNNITFGLPNISPSQVVEAAKIANAHEFIAQLENGYDTIIGDRGMRLSGGERQRLTIARAILRNPPILILDEATSSLDSASEKAVQVALSNVMKDRTVIAIAHRLSTIKDADEILVMNEGEIAESGTHEELMAKNGLYSKMIALQMFS
jgi:subfamily B ATP-binding cassette protein MsbA